MLNYRDILDTLQSKGYLATFTTMLLTINTLPISSIPTVFTVFYMLNAFCC